MSSELPLMKVQQKEMQYPEWYKNITGKDCKVEKIIKFLMGYKYLKKYKHNWKMMRSTWP